MRIGITGSNGFLGRIFSNEVLVRDHSFVRIPLPRDSKLQDKIFLRDHLSQFKVDALIHCAASLMPRTSQENHLNVEIPAILSDFFTSSIPANRFIFLSSYKVSIPSLADPYSQSKRLAEQRLKASGHCLRPDLVWDWNGKGMEKEWLILYKIS